MSSDYRLRSFTQLFTSCWSGWPRRSRVCVSMAPCLMMRRLCRRLSNNTRQEIQIMFFFILVLNFKFRIQCHSMTVLVVTCRHVHQLKHWFCDCSLSSSRPNMQHYRFFFQLWFHLNEIALPCSSFECFNLMFPENNPILYLNSFFFLHLLLLRSSWRNWRKSEWL